MFLCCLISIYGSHENVSVTSKIFKMVLLMSFTVNITSIMTTSSVYERKLKRNRKGANQPITAIVRNAPCTVPPTKNCSTANE